MRIIALFLCFALWATVLPSLAEAQARVLWFNGMDNGGGINSERRKKMADHLDRFENGTRFDVTYARSIRGGGLAQSLAGGTFDIVVLDITRPNRRLNSADQQALQQFYASGRRALMLDGSLAIRSFRDNATTEFPGPNGSTGNLLVNQVAMLAAAGGGILIAADHSNRNANWQANSNMAVRAILPDAGFRGVTNPSTDGDFIGAGLLSDAMPVIARDILRHWESVPNQGEAPVGTFTAFDGTPVTLYSLVEAADKPGGGRKRPYISASIFPGQGKTAIDSDQAGFENLPTHKSGTRP